MARQPMAASDVVAFTFAVLALLLAALWRRERQPGLLWLASAFTLNGALAAVDEWLPVTGNAPNRTHLLLNYGVHMLYAMGLVKFLAVPARHRLAAVALLVGPVLVAAAAVLAGLPLTRPQAILPLVLEGFCAFGLTCWAARRERGSGLELLAVAALAAPSFVVWQGLQGGHLLNARYYAWLPAFCLGVTFPVVSLMRKQREAQQAQQRAARLSALYEAVSRASSLIARGPSPQALYHAICEVCVSLQSARFACVTEVRDGWAQRVAWAGDGSDFFGDDTLARWRMDERAGQGSITALAIATEQPQVCDDYLAQATPGPWRQHAQAHGIRAIAVFPFRRGGQVVGALSIYDHEPRAFDAQLMQLFGSLAEDISFALDNHDRRLQREQALAEARAGFDRFQQLFQSAPLIAVILRLSDRRVVDINVAGCERYGLRREQVVGSSMRDLGMGQSDWRRDAFFAALQRDGRVRNFEATLQTLQGPREALLNAEVIDYQGETCVLAMGLDIADLRAAEQAQRALAVAHAANEAKTEFLSRVSHELRTPMNAVLGFAQLLRGTGAGRLLPADVTKIDHILHAGHHLLKLIDDVLDVSRIEAGRLHVQSAGVRLATVLAEATALVEPLAERHGVQLAPVRCEPADAAALADETRLRQVVVNLLSNAIKYNRPAGHVVLSVQVAADSVDIVVEDSGIGMTPEQLRQLYEPFNRLGRERGGIEGTGIGLALTRQLVGLMGGSLQIDSASGVGTRARVTLPRGAPVAALPGALVCAPAQRTPDTPVPAPERGVVLYIEDNPINVMLVAAMLDAWPQVQLVEAEMGHAGIALARSLAPDLVLLDMQLPDMTGIEVIRALRADDATRHLRIVVLSASAMPEEVAEARAAGADDYWTKPVDYAAFLRGVGGLLTRA